MQERAHRDEFRYLQLLQYAKNARIEQLQREKDRLRWDWRLMQPSSSAEPSGGEARPVGDADADADANADADADPERSSRGSGGEPPVQLAPGAARPASRVLVGERRGRRQCAV